MLPLHFRRPRSREPGYEAERPWADCDNRYIAAAVSLSTALLSLYSSISTNNTHAGTFWQAQCRVYVDMNVTKQQYSRGHRSSKSIGRFWFTQARWQVAGQLQLHCLSTLNPFIPCVCAFTYLSSLAGQTFHGAIIGGGARGRSGPRDYYLSSSITFTANTSSSSRASVRCGQVHTVVNHAREHVGIHGAF